MGLIELTGYGDLLRRAESFLATGNRCAGGVPRDAEDAQRQGHRGAGSHRPVRSLSRLLGVAGEATERCSVGNLRES